MSRHEGVSCDNCLTSNFQEKRFKCLICYDYDLCEVCFDNNVSTSRHTPSHPMQCILTSRDFDLFYGGEGTTMDNPPALTCPLCGKRGFTIPALQEHVNSLHMETTVEVVCPICAAIPSGEPNHVTDDFTTHLAIEHNTSHRANAEESGRPSMRRMFYPGRSVRGARSQRSSNMHFSSGPTSLVPGFSTVANVPASLPHTRDPYSDPIAELLSQLSGVRRSAQQLHQSVSGSTASQLQELQAQLQLERQRASLIRQQLERIPGSKIQTNQNIKQTANQSTSGQGRSYATAVKSAERETASAMTEDEDPRLLLSQIYDGNVEANEESEKRDSFEQSLFVRELIHSLPIRSDSTSSSDFQPLAPQPSAVRARAIPVDCGKFSSFVDVDSENKRQNANDNPHIINELDGLPSSNTEERNDGGLENNDQEYGAVGNAEITDGEIVAARDVNDDSCKSNGEEKIQNSSSVTDLKKDPSNLRSASNFSSGATNVQGMVRSQSSHPVPNIPLLVSGASEQ